MAAAADGGPAARTRTGMTAALVETAANVEHVLQHLAPGGDLLLVAVAPGALQALRERRVPHVLLDRYCTFAELDCWLAGRRQLLEQFCDAFDAQLGALNREYRQESFRVARAFMYYFKYTTEPAIIAGYKLDRFLATAQPARLIGFRNPPVAVTDAQRADLWEAVLRSFSRQSPAVPVEFIDQVPAAATGAPATAPGQQTPGEPRLSGRQLVAAGMRSLTASAWGTVRKLSTGASPVSVLVTDRHLDGLLRRSLMRQGMQVIHLPANLGRSGFAETPETLTPEVRAALDAFLRSPAAERYGTTGQLSVLPAVRRAVELFAANAAGLFKLYHDMRAFLADANITVVLARSFSFGSGVYAPVLALAARHAGIRTVSFQHGAEGTYARATALRLMDLECVTTFFVWGEAERRNLRQVYGDDKYAVAGNVLRIGPGAGAGRPRTGGKANVLFVPREFRLYHTLDSWDDPVWSYAANYYWLFVKKNLDLLLEQVPAINLTIKLYPHEVDFIVTMIRQHCAAAGKPVTIIRAERSYEELLGEADAVVFDYFGTPLFQAVQTDCEIFIYTHGRFTPESEQTIARRAHYHRTYAGFRQAFAAYVRDWPAAPGPRDESFFREYLNANRIDTDAIARVLCPAG